MSPYVALYNASAEPAQSTAAHDARFQSDLEQLVVGRFEPALLALSAARTLGAPRLRLPRRASPFG
jgi:hypothetical protein